jgi:chromate transport protein ChrA
MSLSEKSLGFVINFLLGVAWATVLIGAISTFLSYYSDSLFFAILSGLVATVPGMIAVLILEHIIISKDKYLELQKQTKLLQLLLQEKDNQL